MAILFLTRLLGLLADHIKIFLNILEGVDWIQVASICEHMF